MCIFLLLCFSALGGASIAPTHLFVNRVGPCAGAPKLAVSLSEFGITRKFYDFIISGQMNITKNFSNGWDMQATMQKCPDIRNLDTCDFYRAFPVVRAGCTGPDAHGFDLYTMFFYYTNPRMSCPIQAGNYTFENYPYYTEDNYLAVAETKISTSIFGYTLKLEAFSEDEPVMCLEAHLRLLYIRDHNWLDVAMPEVTEAAEAEADDEE